MKYHLLCLLLLLLFFLNTTNAQVRKGPVKRLVKRSEIVQGHFTGFTLYDFERKRMVFDCQGDKYFTPASNTKLFTFYTCLNMLGDSIPALNYTIRGDTLVFWGTGDPTFLHPDFKEQRAFGFLKAWKGPLVYAAGNYNEGFFGSGWPLDDYNAYYQPEKCELPLYGNIVRLKANGEKLVMNPAYFAGVFLADADTSQKGFYVRRDVFENRFHYPQKQLPEKFEQDIPYKTDEWLTATLLSDTLGKKIIVKTGLEKPAYTKTIYSVNADTLYRHMLQPSDNFMAEQLLLVCSSVKFRTLSTDSVISYATRTFLADLPNKPQWADGSGLSRQNLFTPLSLIALLEKIRDKISNEKLLFSLMPEGGKSGTLRGIYTSEKAPFIWAKTGSLSNVHNQSGYMITKKGHKLAYSFMNNNFTRPTRDVRNEMVRIMTAIHDKF